MIVDQGELDETIVDEMDLDDEEYKTFVEGRDGRLFENEDSVPQDWGNFDIDELTVNDGHDSNWVYNQIEITSGQLFHDKKHLQHAVKKWSFLEKNHSRWSFPIRPLMMSSVSPRVVPGAFTGICRRLRATLWPRSSLPTRASFQKLL